MFASFVTCGVAMTAIVNQSRDFHAAASYPVSAEEQAAIRREQEKEQEIESDNLWDEFVQRLI